MNVLRQKANNAKFVKRNKTKKNNHYNDLDITLSTLSAMDYSTSSTTSTATGSSSWPSSSEDASTTTLNYITNRIDLVSPTGNETSLQATTSNRMKERSIIATAAPLSSVHHHHHHHHHDRLIDEIPLPLPPPPPPPPTIDTPSRPLQRKKIQKGINLTTRATAAFVVDPIGRKQSGVSFKKSPKKKATSSSSSEKQQQQQQQQLSSSILPSPIPSPNQKPLLDLKSILKKYESPRKPQAPYYNALGRHEVDFFGSLNAIPFLQHQKSPPRTSKNKKLDCKKKKKKKKKKNLSAPSSYSPTKQKPSSSSCVYGTTIIEEEDDSEEEEEWNCSLISPKMKNILLSSQQATTATKKPSWVYGTAIEEEDDDEEEEWSCSSMALIHNKHSY